MTEASFPGRNDSYSLLLPFSSSSSSFSSSPCPHTIDARVDLSLVPHMYLPDFLHGQFRTLPKFPQ
ncbi:hypothetical protein E2C01_004224 [Portunus trituberculatus]|uniref:Uncharacterized protein n=1 Tax=Portunus trituberculatus TaxID=210409 RepID=A0A5B7CPB3_PORTR|nr:hypothetical protein [Portunus trituberculatus]